EGREGAVHLALLVIEPRLLPRFLRPPALLVDREHAGIHDPVGECLQRQRVETRGARAWYDDAAAGLAVEELQDDARIEQGRPVLQHERGDLAERIDAADWVVRAPRVRRLDADAVGKSTERGADFDL